MELPLLTVEENLLTLLIDKKGRLNKGGDTIPACGVRIKLLISLC